MNISISYPNAKSIDRFIASESTRDYSYEEVGGSRSDEVRDYDNDHNFTDLGQGEAVWEAAKSLLQSWQQFPDPWTKIYPAQAPLQVGQNVAVIFRIWGFWFTNSARIVYVLDEPNRYGFAYGTLPGHVEKGEECFWIERDEQGQISYHIRAFSKPRFWLARLGYPFARRFQRKFVQQSMSHMTKLTALAS